jgi:hypothetical protein
MIMQTPSKDITRGKAATLLGICLLAPALQANVSIKPAYVEVNMDEGRPAGVFYISNLGDKEERYRINAIHFNYTEEGTLSQSLKGQYSLAPWIRFNPRELTVAPGTQRAVRFAIVPREKLTEGEWWGAMELESLAVGDIVTKDEKSGRTFQLKAITKIVAPIFGTVGKPTYEGQVKDLQVRLENGEVILKALVAATGTGRLGIKDTHYEILDASGKVIDRGPYAVGYVFRGAQRWLTKKIEAAIPKGEYRVKISLPAAYLEQPLAKEAVVTWPETPPLGVQASVAPGVQPVSDPQQGQSGNPTDGSKQMEVQGSAGNK